MTPLQNKRQRRRAKIGRMALKLAIVASGQTHERIAARAHFTPVQLSNIINGRRALSPTEQARLAGALHTTIIALFPEAC